MPDKPPRGQVDVLLMCFVSVGLFVMGADIIPLSLRPLRYLGIAYPAPLDYTYVIAPVVGLAIWLALRRRRPLLAGVAGWLVASVTISAVMGWADRQPTKVRVVRWIDPTIDSADVHSVEARLGFKIYETGTGEGNELWVRPENAAAVTAEAKRLGILDDGSGRGVIRPRPRPVTSTTAD
jgi:hypothetical protein